MRAFLLATLLLASPAALAATEEEPEATPSPTPEARPAQPATRPVAEAPARDRLGWEAEAALTWQGVFDGGIHVFSEGFWLGGAEMRVRRSVELDRAIVFVSPELAYGAAHAARGYPGTASTELWLQRLSAGARASVRIRALGPARPFLRGGATGLWGTALAHGPYRHHREEAYGWGAYGSAGLEVDLAAARLAPGRRHWVLGAEAGHLYTPGLNFGRMGVLAVNGAHVSAQLSRRF